MLASTSVYRHELLARLGWPFETARPQVDETPLPTETVPAAALRLAEAKARSVAEAFPDALIIGSDQLADCGGQPVGKPGNHDEARAQLLMLSGRTIVFHTGVALLDAQTSVCEAALVSVRSTFRPLSPAAIEAYLRRERPYDCAGSAKIEGLGIALFSAVESDDPTALIGLPLIRLTDMLIRAGQQVLA